MASGPRLRSLPLLRLACDGNTKSTTTKRIETSLRHCTHPLLCITQARTVIEKGETHDERRQVRAERESQNCSTRGDVPSGIESTIRPDSAPGEF
jgi:hypothetical protein